MTDLNNNEPQKEDMKVDNPEECDINEQLLSNDLSDAIKELPEEQRKKVLHSCSLFMQRSSISPVSSPLMDKLDTDLVGKLIDNSENESIRDYAQNKFDKICGIVVLIIVLLTTVILLYVFREHIDDIRDFIMPIIYIGVGAIGGYGYRGMKEKI